MNERIPSSEKRRFAKRLRREAIESRPAFSELLHRRIVEAVHSAASESRQNAPAPSPRRVLRRSPAALLAAACLLLGVAAIGWRLASLAQPQNAVDETPLIVQSQSAELPSIDEMTDRAATGLDRLVDSVALTPQADHLEHDVRLAVHALLERLPLDAEMADALAVDER